MSTPRMDVISRLLVILRDQSLSVDQNVATVASDSEVGPAELQVIAETLAVEGRTFLSDFRPLTDHTQSLMLGISIKEMGAIAAAYLIISRWDLIFKRPEMPLADVIKVLPVEDVEAILRAMRWGGLVDP